MWIRWQTHQHSSSSSGHGAVELSLAAAHRWVSSLCCLPSCVFPFFLLETRSKNVTFDCHPLCFQRSYAWSSPGRLKLVTRKPPPSTHPLWLGKKQRWRFSYLKRTTQTERSGEGMKSAERLSWLAVTDMTSRVFFSQLMVPCLSCSLSVVVEDVSSSCCVTVKVFPYMTVAALKQQVRKMSFNR